MTVGDWIKMRSSLASDPKVNAIGKHLEQNPRFFYWLTCDQHSELSLSDNALRHVVTGALHNVWSNANQHCENGVLKHADLSWIDNTCGVPGFGEAMSSVGWVVAETGCLIFPKFNDNNTSAAERQKKYRERKKGQEHNGDVTRNVTRDNGVTPREEKIREDKNDNLLNQGECEAVVDKPKKKTGFIKPTIEEIAAYCLERKNNIDAAYFFDRYEGNGWMSGKTKMVDWKATIRTWEKNNFQTNANSHTPQPTSRPDGFPDVRIRKPT